ncbi:hypothetical protein PHLGIDRAFT_38244, partial [Phlebiopsis gigantea 11061_1 CR5-6]
MYGGLSLISCQPSRPQSILETLVERKDSESDTVVLRPLPAAVRARPTSLFMSASDQGHMPRSIFPDMPATRRSSTTPALLSPPAATIPASRRHTTYLVPSPMAAPPRREQRPLRSSPLAGPSLALSDDGTLTGSDASFERRRFRPNRISSTPDVTMSTLMQLEGRSVTSLSEPTSPAGTCRGVSPPPLPLDQIAVEQVHDKAPSPPEPVKKSMSRRLSLGFKRLSGLPSMPSPDPSDNSDTASMKSTRSRTLSTKSKEAAAPPVPSIPVWARPSYLPEGPHPSSPTSPSQPSSAKSSLRRPSSAHSTGSSPSTRRRSVLFASHETLPGPSTPADAPAPNTSRNPDENWMSAATAPKFSRLGLRGDGVVLPLTAKE